MIWLELRDVEAFHSLQITDFGGLAGTRDRGALESAIARPLNLAAYGKPTVFELAASYAFGIARNHPFVDGNKRTALVTCFTFLELNGRVVNAPETDSVLTFVDLAAGKLSEKELARWLEAHCGRRRKEPRK
ncbi:MAG: type II toxin-antitoxin system death-on-curing family toxin [Pseudomonadota bacterium]|nr:type II toxin-antitoxin system death-on-curing family toxin [Pseudomonadota bacterium]